MEQSRILARKTDHGFKTVEVVIKGEQMTFDQSDFKAYFTAKEPEAISEFQSTANRGQCYGCELSREDALNMLVDEQFNDDDVLSNVINYILNEES